jgi:DNA primase
LSNDDDRRAIEQIKLRAPIEEVVRERVPDLKKSSALWVACCPFHDEKTPSFKVNPQRGTWYCFGACSKGGDQFDFVMAFDRVGFRDALEILAARTGVELPRRGPRDEADRDMDKRLIQVMDRTVDVYRKRLAEPEGRAAREYIEQRGLSAETCAAFRIGWAPAGGRALCEDLARTLGDGGQQQLEDAGLARRSADGRPYDFFRGRLMIPIADMQGRCIGFGGRRLSGDGPKYVNTPETKLFHKGRLIYALDQALADVRRTGHIVLVEGYTDVMAAHQCGIKNVVAVLGTSTTEEHAGLLRRTGARRVSLVFDGDEAGRKAAIKALAGLLPIGVELDVVRLPGNEDPCDLLMREGAEPFLAQLELARPWFDFLLDGLGGLEGVELSREVDIVLELLGRLSKPVHRDSLLQTLASRLGMPAATLRAQREGLAGRRVVRAPASPPQTNNEERSGASASPMAKAEEPIDPKLRRAYGEILGAVLLDPSLAPLARSVASACPVPDIAEALRVVLELYEDESLDLAPDVFLGTVLDQLAERPVRAKIVPIREYVARAENPKGLLEDQLAYLESRSLKVEKARLERSLLERENSLSETVVAQDAEALELVHRIGAIRDRLSELRMQPMSVPQA